MVRLNITLLNTQLHLYNTSWAGDKEIILSLSEYLMATERLDVVW